MKIRYDSGNFVRLMCVNLYNCQQCYVIWNVNDIWIQCLLSGVNCVSFQTLHMIINSTNTCLLTCVCKHCETHNIFRKNIISTILCKISPNSSFDFCEHYLRPQTNLRIPLFCLCSCSWYATNTDWSLSLFIVETYSLLSQTNAVKPWYSPLEHNITFNMAVTDVEYKSDSQKYLFQYFEQKWACYNVVWL